MIRIDVCAIGVHDVVFDEAVGRANYACVRAEVETLRCVAVNATVANREIVGSGSGSVSQDALYSCAVYGTGV